MYEKFKMEFQMRDDQGYLVKGCIEVWAWNVADARRIVSRLLAVKEMDVSQK